MWRPQGLRPGPRTYLQRRVPGQAQPSAETRLGVGLLGCVRAMCEMDCFLLGRMFIFYGNKTSTQFLNFTPTLICSDDLQANILGSICPMALTAAIGGGGGFEEGFKKKSE